MKLSDLNVQNSSLTNLSESTFSAEAPSNIALIKYMGKVKGGKNVATNPSLSYTLNHLKTRVTLERWDRSEDAWESLPAEGGFSSIQLSEHGMNRFCKHLAFLKESLGVEGNYLIRSGNNFPSDCGLASSASSFAALTMAVGQVLKSQKKAASDASELADLSRQGSGSSGRSFFSPWALWDEEGLRGIELPQKNLLHDVVIVNDEKKEVSSSEAHLRVLSSLLFSQRVQRADDRLKMLIQQLREDNWEAAFENVWAEFWDMHALFETSSPSFGYMTSGSFDVLSRVRNFWRKEKSGPLVTMDAGANIHLLYRPQDQEQRLFLKNSLNDYQFYSGPDGE